MSVEINGATLQLLPERAVLWPQEKVLLVADVHLGKEHAFGRSGIAIPAGSSENTLLRLSELLTKTQVTECIVLGDFFHDTPLSTDSWLQQVAEFLDQHPAVRVSVVAGNHDKKIGQPRIDKRILWHQNPIHRGPLVLQHEPGSDARGYVLAGHVHPVVSLRPGFQRGVRGPCFWQRQHYTVLPAFGDFTGGFSISPTVGDSVYLTGPDCIIPIPVEKLALRRKRPLGV